MPERDEKEEIGQAEKSISFTIIVKDLKFSGVSSEERLQSFSD